MIGGADRVKADPTARHRSGAPELHKLRSCIVQVPFEEVCNVIKSSPLEESSSAQTTIRWSEPLIARIGTRSIFPSLLPAHKSIRGGLTSGPGYLYQGTD